MALVGGIFGVVLAAMAGVTGLLTLVRGFEGIRTFGQGAPGLVSKNAVAPLVRPSAGTRRGDHLGDRLRPVVAGSPWRRVRDRANFLHQTLAALTVTLSVGTLLDRVAARLVLLGSMALLAAAMVAVPHVGPGVTAAAYGMAVGSAGAAARTLEATTFPACSAWPTSARSAGSSPRSVSRRRRSGPWCCRSATT